jgi:hypothetical protein
MSRSKKKRRGPKPPKRRNMQVVNMIARYARTRTNHGDAKKQASKRACRGRCLPSFSPKSRLYSLT